MNYCKICGAEIAGDSDICEECKSRTEESDTEKPVETVEAVTEVPTENQEPVAEAAPEAMEEVVPEGEALEEAPKEESEEDIEEEPEKPKKEGGWNYVTTIVVVVAAAICITLFALFAAYKGWLDNIIPKIQSSCTMDNFTNVEILKSEVEVTDDLLQQNIDYILQNTGYSELNEESISVLSEYYFGETCSTEDEFRELLREKLYESRLEGAVYDYLDTVTTVKTYDQELKEQLEEYYNQSLDSYASNMGTTADVYAQYMGYNDAQEYAGYLAEYYLKMAMIEDKILQKYKVSFTEEDVDAKIAEYMEDNGYSDYYTLDEFNEMTGEVWRFIFTTADLKYDLMMDALKDDIVVLEDAVE